MGDLLRPINIVDGAVGKRDSVENSKELYTNSNYNLDYKCIATDKRKFIFFILYKLCKFNVRPNYVYLVWKITAVEGLDFEFFCLLDEMNFVC